MNIQRYIKGSGAKRHMTKCNAWCNCGWSSPTCENNEALDAEIDGHV